MAKNRCKTESSAKSAVEVTIGLAKQGNNASVTDRGCTEQVKKGIEIRLQRLSEAELALKVSYNRSPGKILEIKYKTTLGKGGEMKIKSKIKNKRRSMARGEGNLGCRPP